MTRQEVEQKLREYRDRGYPGVGGVEIHVAFLSLSPIRVIPDITSMHPTMDEFSVWNLDEMEEQWFNVRQVRSWKVLGGHEHSGYEYSRDASNLPHVRRAKDETGD